MPQRDLKINTLKVYKMIYHLTFVIEERRINGFLSV